MRHFHVCLMMYVCVSDDVCMCEYETSSCLCLMMYSQSHLDWHFRMRFQSSKLKAQSSNVSFHWNIAKETFELWALSFRKCHPKWDWLYVCVSIRPHHVCPMMYVCVSILSCVCVYVYVWAYIMLSDHVPRAKEIWLVILTNAKISNKISSSQRNLQTSFHGIPKNSNKICGI